MSDALSLQDRGPAPIEARAPRGPDLDGRMHPGGTVLFLLVLVGGLGYALFNLITDMQAAGQPPLAIGAFALLGLALLIALGFEFVNGFHDTANAVATVIYTHSLPPVVAVVYSGVFNFLGVLVSTGAVAYSVVTLLPVELVLKSGSSAGYAMIFALLIAAIVWNLGTWALGLPNSSSHALIGSVLGVGLANQLLATEGSDTSGVPWDQAWSVLRALLFSPLVGFVMAALLLLTMRFLIRNRTLYQEPEGDTPPPLWIRALLILTCGGVSFAHGGNDGQKGMGLIMLILIGAAPTAYALNRTMTESATPHFVQVSERARTVFQNRADQAPMPSPAEGRAQITGALGKKDLDRPETYAALAALSDDIATKVKEYGAIRHVPAAATPNLRNDMFLTSDAIHSLKKREALFVGEEAEVLKAYETSLNDGTRYIPTWVKVSVALALGLGTMVGWKRIVVTVGSRIGKKHLTYAQGASAEITAAGTIGLAEAYGLPVSTTHILSSGVAGTMAANGSGLQWATMRNLAAAWLLTLPAAITLAGLLYAGLRFVF
ncbi:inorganic phosphate transporter [Methylobacterium sp. AMS5]|uniref:inorganic phosphate transporter n=1 Tax=Methylobacterium sp. AMS5 TaxID=925818 RepID=UPI00074F996E|nr:inorganic phosphate transporter [Methylobacterium sp. AMS5]AMB48125.1 nuclease PIN [Methylobacterium sp. AMS5]